MFNIINRSDVFGLIRPAIDAHTLGLHSLHNLLKECGFRVVIADNFVCKAMENPRILDNIKIIERWIRQHGITRLGVSYRLDSNDGKHFFNTLLSQLISSKLFSYQGGFIHSLYFAGLSDTCKILKKEHGEIITTFEGDETPHETLEKIGVPQNLWPVQLATQHVYDEARYKFANDLLKKEKHLQVKPISRSGYSGYGTKSDLLSNRIQDGIRKGLPPLMRAHLGPYDEDHSKALKLFLDWCQQLAKAGYLDILSIGTSQLTQSSFGEKWHNKLNGGGVPINHASEYESIWKCTRPMLVRTYAGSINTQEHARMCEETINMAWHALSIWWFCRIDGRGILQLRDNITMQLETLKVIAKYKKPYEPNIAHHFAFRGADDVTCIASTVLAAKLAKKLGIQSLVLQIMLNTPKNTWGIHDLAKARVTLNLVRELEDNNFKVYLQPRTGINFLSKNQEKAKVQLASATAMMDDIEPHNEASPEIIHVVSYSEGSQLANPVILNESIQITRAAITEYRKMRRKKEIEDMTHHPEVIQRTQDLVADVRTLLSTIEKKISSPYTAQGFYDIFASGFFSVPFLLEDKEEFSKAVQWKTKIIQGSVKIVDDSDAPISIENRLDVALNYYTSKK